MGINWRLRFQNKVTLTSLVVQIIAIVYAVLSMMGIVPSIDENQILEVVYMVIEVLCLIGIVVDPTTKGISDSTQAYNYEQPR